ncbi:hypothetical protein EV356DRAFT_505849 [Viridothelium virens]|uniref:Methyltransferase domain-containing protein n=1 Tax=Viridothelium virens TaxID=1048519 RepID=A0A6A6HK78_VIRVR|nr:hypothetical protein EV356DRAFT_505849 [Viridothelium virens]
MATTDDGYMLPRDSTESKRLDAQHKFLRSLSKDYLVHPEIPWKNLNAVADVATGTGIWLRELASSSEFRGKNTSFVGFDISPQQYPTKEELEDGVELVVHDMTRPFPLEYHEQFDLVNVRLVSWVLQARDLEKTVRNIIQLLRPGGYLQWQECDPGDSWTAPETPISTSIINHLIPEKIARGLLPGIATPLIRTIQSLQTEVPQGHQNPNSFNSDSMRIRRLETVSTAHIQSAVVIAGKRHVITGAALTLLEPSMRRKRAAAAASSIPSSEKEQLDEDAQEIADLIDAIKREESDAVDNWNFEMTWIIARKAIVMGKTEAWMAIKYPNSV